jgi:hypothetical protein
MFGFDDRDKRDIPFGFRLHAGLSPPDYGNPEAWALHPGHRPLTAWPRGYGPEPPAGAAHVFYLHPTTLRGVGAEWNAGWHDSTANGIADEWPLRHQASAFRGVGPVFAPRYRQAHLRVFYTQTDDGIRALDLAYSDVRRAFQHYLDHLDQGQPLLLAAHSQGSLHAARLLREFFDGPEPEHAARRARLIAAYLPGMDLGTRTFERIPPLLHPDATGGFLTWMTVAEGHYPEYYKPSFVDNATVNPVHWRPEGATFSPFKDHLGILNRNFKVKYTAAISARPHDGLLWIKPLRVPLGPLLQLRDWHIADYNLFWANIRHNAEHRLARWHQP